MGIKKFVVNIGLKFLGKGLVSCSKIEKAVQEEIEFYKDGFIIELKVFNTDTKIAVEKIELASAYMKLKII